MIIAESKKKKNLPFDFELPGMYVNFRLERLNGKQAHYAKWASFVILHGNRDYKRSLVKSTKFGTHRSTLSVAAMSAARRRKLECGAALCELQSRTGTERHSSQSPKGSPRILQQKKSTSQPDAEGDKQTISIK